MRGGSICLAAVTVAAVLLASGLDATTIARLWPTPSEQSRANDTPVVDHVAGGGPNGGYVESLAIVRTSPAMVFAALRGGGVYASSDRGATWRPADRGLPALGWCDLVADASGTSTLYAACDDGLFKTTNRGVLWRQLDINNAVPPIIAPSDSRVVYQPPGAGMVLSVDGGRRWTHVGKGSRLGCRSNVVVDPGRPRKLFCGGERGIMTSVDGGATWEAMSDAYPRVEVESIVIDPDDRDTMLISASDGRTFKSTTGGESWFRAGDAPGGEGFDEMRFVSGPGQIVYAVQGLSGLFRSADGGARWAVIPPVWPDNDFVSFTVDPMPPETLYVGTSRGVWMTTDGGRRWTSRNMGITRAATWVVLHEGAPATLYANLGHEVFTSRDSGASWEAVTEGELAESDLTSLSSDGDGGLRVRAGGDILHLSRDAEAWTREAVPSTAEALAVGFAPHAVATADGGFAYSTGDGRWHMAPTRPNGRMPGVVVAAGPEGTIFAAMGALAFDFARLRSSVWRSGDGGGTWQRQELPYGRAGSACCSLFVDPNDRDTIYALINGVGIGGSGSVMARTTNAGQTWTELTGPLVTAFAVVPTEPTTVIAQHWGGGLVSSTDRGTQWEDAGAGLPELVEITNIVADRRRPTTLFAGTRTRGVYRSLDGGRTWQPTGRVE